VSTIEHRFGRYGGQYVPETLMPALAELELAWVQARDDAGNPNPLALSRASALVGRRCVVVGNAAQALHPVAGQGFNLGLRDAATLAECVAGAADCRAELARLMAGPPAPLTGQTDDAAADQRENSSPSEQTGP